MGWQGAGGGGAATIGTYYFFGGMLQIIGSMLEWFIGNTFPFVVFGSFGNHILWLFFFLDIALFLLTGAYWKAAAGDAMAYGTLEKVGRLRS